MLVTHKETKHGVEISASVENLEAAFAEFNEYLKELPVDGQDKKRWELIFYEIVSNAVVHGSGEDKNKVVKISWWDEDYTVYLSAEDSGKGPDMRLVDYPELPEDELAVSGRGMYIIHRNADIWQHEKSNKGYTQIVGRRYLLF